MFYLKVEKVFVIFTKAFVKFFPIYFGEKIFSLSALVSKYFTQKKYKKRYHENLWRILSINFVEIDLP